MNVAGDYWWLPHICTEKNIACRKNGGECTLPDVTRGSEFNNNRDSKKVLDTEAETTNKKDYTDTQWMSAPIPGQLPPDRTNGRRSFQVIGLDFAGPITYKGKKDSLKQAYVFLITCSLSRAAHIELVGSQKIEEFIREFKRFVARRGKRTRRTYSRMELECLLLFVANRRSVSEIQGTFKNFQGQSPFQMVW